MTRTSAAGGIYRCLIEKKKSRKIGAPIKPIAPLFHRRSWNPPGAAQWRFADSERSKLHPADWDRALDSSPHLISDGSFIFNFPYKIRFHFVAGRLNYFIWRHVQWPIIRVSITVPLTIPCEFVDLGPWATSFREMRSKLQTSVKKMLARCCAGLFYLGQPRKMSQKAANLKKVLWMEKLTTKKRRWRTASKRVRGSLLPPTRLRLLSGRNKPDRSTCTWGTIIPLSSL